MSDISLACRQIGPIRFKAKFEQGEDIFRKRRSLLFKKMQIVRGCDTKRNVLVYMVYSDRIIEGSPKNSTSSVPVMPWGVYDKSRNVLTSLNNKGYCVAGVTDSRKRHPRSIFRTVMVPCVITKAGQRSALAPAAFIDPCLPSRAVKAPSAEGWTKFNKMGLSGISKIAGISRY